MRGLAAIAIQRQWDCSHNRLSRHLAYDVGYRLINHAKLVCLAAIRRHDVDRVAERPDKQIARQEALIETRADASQIAGLPRCEIQCGDRADLADIGEPPVVA